MLCRVEILRGPAKRVIFARYYAGRTLTEIEEIAESERRAHSGNGFRIRNLHTEQIREVGPDTP